MMYTIVLTHEAGKQLRRIPLRFQEKVLQAIRSLAQDPFAGKKLYGDWEGHYSERAWPYRIIYTIDLKEITVTIVTVGHRQGIYK